MSDNKVSSRSEILKVKKQEKNVCLNNDNDVLITYYCKHMWVDAVEMVLERKSGYYGSR